NDAGTGDEQGESQSGNDADTGDEQGEDQSGSKSGSRGKNTKFIPNAMVMANLNELQIKDIHEMLDQIIDRQADEYSETNPMEQSNLIRSVNTVKPTSVTGQERHDDAMKIAGSMRRMIESALWSKSEQPLMYDDHGIDFDDSLLAGVPAGNARIFIEQDIVETAESAMVILVDMSGSLSSKQSAIANCSAKATAIVLEELGVKVMVMHFDDEVKLTKDWEQRSSETQFGYSDGGGTDTGSAMAKALAKLQVMENARKQILIFTDGDPNSIEDVIHQADIAKELKVDVASIQLAHNKYAGIEYFKVIQTPENIPEAMREIVTEKMLDAISIG
ncbi:vWA domain-containing protein, partial [Enterovibrio norvegicus]|uniref:vWA domain-containing protein n=1 Tax=Enterovibrio norvegicus TaxID=188144 RepID=UPI00352EF76C